MWTSRSFAMAVLAVLAAANAAADKNSVGIGGKSSRDGRVFSLFAVVKFANRECDAK